MKRLIIISFVLLIAGSSNAVWYPHEDSGVTVDIPRSWKVTGDANSLQAKTKDGNAAVFMRVMPAEKAEAALAALDAELSKVVQDLKHNAAEELEVNGLKAYWVDGTGQVDGHNVEVDVILVQTPKGQSLLVFGIIAEEAAKKQHKGMVRILRSIKPIE